MSVILERTLTFLLEQPGISNREIRAVHLNNYFTVVELDDTNVGACMSNYLLPHENLVERQSAIRSMLCQDPLLLRFTEAHAASDGVARSIRAATINALSSPFLRVGEDSFFTVQNNFPHHFFKEIKYAVVIGFGGFLDYLVRHTSVQKLHVSDLLYQSRRAEMDTKIMNKKIARYHKERPDIELSVSDGSDTGEHLRKADFVTITGSTLTNNTLEQLLLSARNCKKIILQGQSASIHPKELFASGVHLVATTLKTRDVAKAAFWDPTGNALRPFLEGDLPWIYIWPKSPQDGNLK